MNDDRTNTAQDQASPAADTEAQQSPAQPKKPSSSSWLRRILPTLLICGALAVAAYMIVPRIATSASVEFTEALEQSNEQLSRVLDQAEALRAELKQVKADLGEARTRAEAAEQAVEAKSEELKAAKQREASLTRSLEEARQADEPLRKNLEAARQKAAQAKAAAEQASKRVEGLTEELAMARQRAEKLGKVNNTIQTARANVVSRLKASRSELAETKRFLAALKFGDPQADEPEQPAWPGEMPITEKELVWSLGQPSVSVQKDNTVRMHWGTDHVAWLVDGVAAEIDGKPALRALLASEGIERVDAAAPPGPWRFGKGRTTLHYADLVDLFGHPERVAGSGSRFTAWWTVGAWARGVSATVEEGVVTRFDGGQVDLDRCCELVRHRAQAYQNASKTVQAEVSAAKAFYDKAAAVVAKELARKAEDRRIDGVTLKDWKLAPFDSVGVWIAPMESDAGGMTLRGAVDCTWVQQDGSESVERRYVVVRMVRAEGDLQPVECAVFDGRD